MKIPKDGYEEPAKVPKAPRAVLFAAVEQAVEQGKLWLTAGQASILGEPIPAGLLTDEAQFQPPPPPIPVSDVTSSALPEVWAGPTATAFAIAVALSNKAGSNLPWVTVRDAINGAISARAFELALDSAPWPSDFASAQRVKLKVRATPPPDDKFRLRPNVLVAEAELKANEIQDLADNIAEIRKAAGDVDLKFRIKLELDGSGKTPDEGIVNKLNELLAKVSKALSLK